MKGLDAHWIKTVHQFFIQTGGDGFVLLASIAADHFQQLVQRLVISSRHFEQTLIEPDLHFASGLAGESKRDDIARLSAVDQQAHNARDQQPGFSAAGRGGDSGVQCGGTGIERINRRHDCAVYSAFTLSAKYSSVKVARLRSPI